MKLTMRTVKGDDGSALITVLIIISLLTILGTGLLMMSVSTLRHTQLLNGANKAFYITDGAIEESLAEINEMVFVAEVSANNHIKNSFDFGSDNIFESLSEGSLSESFLSSQVWTDYLMKLKSDLQNEVITQEETMEYIEIGLRCEFLAHYYKQFLDMSKASLTYTLLDSDNNYWGTLENPEEYVKSAVDFGEIESDALNETTFEKLNTVTLSDFVSGVTGFANTGGHSTNPVVSSVSSSFSETDGIRIVLKTNGAYNEHRRALEVAVLVSEPKFTYVFRTAQGNESIFKNEIFDYALTSGKDIVISDGDVNVTGNVYAYGTFPETNDEILPHEMGGIAIGYSSLNGDFLKGLSSKFEFDNMLKDSSSLDGSLTVNGDLFTRANIKIFRIGNDLTVTREVGANGFSTEQNDDNNGDTDIVVDGNVYLFEDLIFRGGGGQTNMRIGKEGTTDGDLYLIHNIEGQKLEPKDISAAMIVQESIADKVSIDLNQLYVGGLAFSSIYRGINDGSNTYKKYFMTGESITVENKYMDFYRSSYAESNGYAGSLDPYIETTYYYDYTDNEGNVTRYEFKGFMELDPTIDNVNESGERSDNLGFKNEVYFAGATQGGGGSSTGIDNVDKQILRIRSLNDDNYKANFALGVIIGHDDTSSGVIHPESLMDIGDYLRDKVKRVVLNANTKLKDGFVGRDVDRRMNYLATRDIKKDTNEVYKYVVPSSSVQPDLNLRSSNQTRINQLINFSKSIQELKDLNNIRIVNPDSNIDVYINPPGVVSSNDIVLGNGLTNVLTDLSGTVATMGDVYIYSPAGVTLDFDGLISSEGRIIFYGPGTKNISLDTGLVHYQVAAYSEMGNAFYAASGRKVVNVGGYFSGEPKIQNQFNTSGMSLPRYTVDYGNPPVIAVMPDSDPTKKINVRLDQPPILVGMQKNKGIRGYEIEYWRETRD